jgi:uncharacterized protein
LSKAGYLLDVNVVVALLDDQHAHHAIALRWFNGLREKWGTCAFTEAGFLRVATSQAAGIFTLANATEALQSLTSHPRFHFWPIMDGWGKLTDPISSLIFGHKQITDAYLLGLAVKEKGILVTLDRGIRHMAGERYAGNVLVLE